MESDAHEGGSDWPAYYPEGCPPDTAQPADGQFWRFVRNDPPTGADFLPAVIAQPKRRFGDGALCMASGLSVIGDLDDVHRARSLVPPLRRLLAALGDIAGHGVMESTPTANCGESHHTWWLPEDEVVHDKFAVEDVP